MNAAHYFLEGNRRVMGILLMLPNLQDVTISVSKHAEGCVGAWGDNANPLPALPYLNPYSSTVCLLCLPLQNFQYPPGHI